MGQQTSSEHAPLTFGYVKHVIEEEAEESCSLGEQDDTKNDFVLDHPHLYQLQTVCKQCTSFNQKSEVIISTLVNETCHKCQQQKRLSFVKRDLQDDLNYIDQTYYPDLVHYNTSNDNQNTMETDPMEVELLEFEKDNLASHQLSRLTIGEATFTPGGTRKRPRRLTGPSMAVDLSNRSLIKLSPSIGYLDSLTKLNLSNNQMTNLPRELGYLKNLRVLNISNNQIDEIPDTIAFLTKLKALNVSHNSLELLPASIGHLPKLVIIIANNNALVSLPRELAALKNLISLDVSNNPLKSLPAQVATIKSLRKLLTDNCAFEEEYQQELKHDPPSLFETCARIATRSQTNIPNQLADHIKHYLSRAETCCHCQGPFFDSFVTRIRFIERRLRQPLALEYSLCSAHWSTENDRVLAMFSQQSTTTKHGQIDIDGLNEDVTTPRNRAYSDLTTSSRRNNTAGPSDYPPTDDYFPISLLKSQPDLPALPLDISENNSLQPQRPQGNRQRASSTASVTKRFANFIRSNSSNSLSNRGRSNSGSSTTSLSSMVSPPKRLNIRDWSANDPSASDSDRIPHLRHHTMPLETI